MSSVTDLIAWQQILRANKDVDEAVRAVERALRVADSWEMMYREFGKLDGKQGIPAIVFNGARNIADKRYPNAAQGNREYKRRYNLTVYVAAEALWHLHDSDINALRDPKARRSVEEFLRALSGMGLENSLATAIAALKRYNAKDRKLLHELAAKVLTADEIKDLAAKGLDTRQIVEIALGRMMREAVRDERTVLGALDKLDARGWLALMRILRAANDRYAAYGFDESLSKKKFKQLVDERFEQLWKALNQRPDGWVGPTKTYPNIKALPAKLRIPSWHVAEKIRGPIQDVDVGGFQKLYEK